MSFAVVLPGLYVRTGSRSNTRRPGDHDAYIAMQVRRHVAAMISAAPKTFSRPVPIGASWAAMQAEAASKGYRITQAERGRWFAEKVTP